MNGTGSGGGASGEWPHGGGSGSLIDGSQLNAAGCLHDSPRGTGSPLGGSLRGLQASGRSRAIMAASDQQQDALVMHNALRMDGEGALPGSIS